jgi:N-acetyl sugar amidotransferase
MDSSDPMILFNEKGFCNHCIEFDEITSLNWHPNEIGQKKLLEVVSKIKEKSGFNKYDCILGLSGGVDSSYLALKVKELGLNPLVVHVDAGWNSELAVANIEVIIKHCNYDLFTHVVDWNDMKALQLAYLKSGISNQDVPQDHIFFSVLYDFAVKNNIKYLISGGNIATEGIFPKAWLGGSAMDSISLKDIFRKFGKGSLKNYKTTSFLKYFILYPFVFKFNTFRPLNYMPYNKDIAIKELESIGWKSYSRKHGESFFTKFYQNHYLPKRFGYDKRLPHLSSMIMSNSISREEALKKIDEPLYNETELINDINYLVKKLDISIEEYYSLMNLPRNSYKNFKNWDVFVKFFKSIKDYLGVKQKGYSE